MSNSGEYKVGIDGIRNYYIDPLKKAKKYLENGKSDINYMTFYDDLDSYNANFNRKLALIRVNLANLATHTGREIDALEKIITDFINADDPGGGGDIPVVPVIPTKVEVTETEDTGKPDISNEEPTIDLEETEMVPDAQIEEVIKILYDDEINITDEERERIIEAIENINTTGILEGIDEDIANRIRAEIVEDYLNGEIELDGITIEELQEYIENHPEIQVGFEINEAIQNFESLIEAGILTTEDIKVVIENNVEIHDSEESFIEADVEAGGLQEDISEIESFYDPETQTVHIRDTADSVIITNSIITILGEEIFIDEETGEVSYYDPDHVEIGESDTTIEMPDGTVDESGNMTDVEIDEDNTTIEVPDGTVDESGNITDAEINEDNTTIEMPEGTVDESGNITDAEINEDDTTIEMPEGTVDESGNITDAEINEDNTTVDISDDGVVSEEETQVKMDNQTAKTDE